MRHQSELLRFRGQGDKTLYNPTVPFLCRGKQWIAARVESLDSETDSQTRFFADQDGCYVLDPTMPSFDLQDPTICMIDGKYVLAGVRVFQQEGGLGWQTDFFMGKDIASLEYFASGPRWMKDIRLVDLGDAVGVFTHPHGGAYGLGQIGYFELDHVTDLSNLDQQHFADATLLKGIFSDGQWGGVSQAIRLTDEKIGVIGHIAHKSDLDGMVRKHYRAMSLVFDRKRHVFSHKQILAQRSDFPGSPAKASPILDDVVFPAGIAFQEDECWLYAGLSDYCCGRIRIRNPFQDE